MRPSNKVPGIRDFEHGWTRGEVSRADKRPRGTNKKKAATHHKDLKCIQARHRRLFRSRHRA